MTDMDMADIEQRLRDAMSASVADARPSFGADDVRRRHRRHRRQAIAASTAAAVAVAFAAVAVRLPSRGPSVPPPPVSSALARRYVDPSFGWKIRYPRGWVLGHFHQQSFATTDGVRLTNFAPDLRSLGQGFPAMGWLRTFPADGVAVQIWFTERIPTPPPLRDSAFPVRAASFSQIRPYEGGSEPRPWYRIVYGDGFTFAAAVWLGPDAGGASERAAWAIVRSLRFSALTGGTIWHGRFYVLGPATRYPVGSVTAFPATSLPRGIGRLSFYLIHGPRAFYVIRATYGPSVSTVCSVAYDARRREFFCPGKKLRWNIAGQPIGKPAASGVDGELGLYIATVAQDGHVLYCPFFGALLPVRLSGSPWGSGRVP